MFSEINKVRGNLFHISTNKEPLQLPDQFGTLVTLSEKLHVPVKDYPDVSIVIRTYVYSLVVGVVNSAALTALYHVYYLITAIRILGWHMV